LAFFREALCGFGVQTWLPLHLQALWRALVVLPFFQEMPGLWGNKNLRGLKDRAQSFYLR